MGEADLGRVVLAGEFEGDVGPDSLVGVFGEVEVGVEDVPHDFLAGDELRDPLLRVVDVLISVAELGAELVSASLDLTGLPSAGRW